MPKDLQLNFTHSFFILTATLLMGCSSSVLAKQASASPDSWKTKVDRMAMKELRRTRLPSVQIAVGYKGEIVYQQAYGYADIDNKIKATPQTLYRTASISKWLTGVATMSLVDSGQLDLDEPIQTYCPEFPAREKVMTTRHLLSHSAGIRHYKRGESNPPSTKHYTDVIDPLESFKNDELLFDPGMGHAYSSHGYRVLGCVISGAAGMPYNDLMEKSVFGPAGMTHTSMDDATFTYPNRAVGYDFKGWRRIKPTLERDVSENLPAGGHLSTASDLIRFSQAFDQGLIVSADSKALMTSLPVAKTGQVIPAGYGHGVDFLSAFPGTIGHGGRQEGATTQVVLWEDDDISIAIMANARGWKGIDKLTEGVYEAFMQGVDD